MQKQIRIGLILTTALLLIFIAACKKETPADQATLDSAKQALANQQLIINSFNIAQRGAEKASGLMKADDRTDTCGILTVTPSDPLAFPKVISVDFGAGCTDGDGKFKSGKVTMTVGAIWQPNSSIIVTYDNYSENGAKLQGTFTFKNISTANAGIFEIIAQDIKYVDANNYSVAYNATQTYTQIYGHASWWDWSDDVYNITGSINSVLTNGEKVDWTIKTPLVKANNCYWVSAGTGLLSINGLDYLIDYGNGNCDNKATATVNGQTYNITL
ncbi:MAG: hypothetical protein KGS48_19285 [Bacteroidetes bacterium]|nr:hypothetical protein [Bacteroidota bacterium]